jgi:hypothetical protein
MLVQHVKHVYGMCSKHLQHLLETYATYHGYLCFDVCMLDAHAW